MRVTWPVVPDSELTGRETRPRYEDVSKSARRVGEGFGWLLPVSTAKRTVGPESWVREGSVQEESERERRLFREEQGEMEELP